MMTKSMNRRLRQIGWTAALVLVIGLAITALARTAANAPDGRIVVASGGAGGLNHEMGERFQATLARHGLRVELRKELEGIASLNALVNRSQGVDAAFLKGGLIGGLQGRYASADDQARHDSETRALRSLGRLFYEPMWVFYRGPEQITSLKDFKGKRIVVGHPTSGARRVVMHLLKANGIDDRNSRLIDQDLDETGTALRGAAEGAGKADVAFVILPPENERVQRLLRAPEILLMDFSAEADAYANRFPFLSKVVMHRNSVEFDPEIPSADITLLATSSVLAVRNDAHSAVVTLLANAVLQNPKSGIDKRGEPILFHRATAFPIIEDAELEVMPEVRALFKTGEMPLLLRSFAPLSGSGWLPFWLVAYIHQHGSKIVLLLIPLLSVLIPLIRILPSLYNWTVRRRLRVMYAELKQLERSVEQEPGPAAIGRLHHELDRIDRLAQRIKYPLAFTDELYDLRGHVELVRQRLAAMERRTTTAAAA